jgi:hypothetical protein
VRPDEVVADAQQLTRQPAARPAAPSPLLLAACEAIRAVRGSRASSALAPAHAPPPAEWQFAARETDASGVVVSITHGAAGLSYPLKPLNADADATAIRHEARRGVDTAIAIFSRLQAAQSR